MIQVCAGQIEKPSCTETLIAAISILFIESNLGSLSSNSLTLRKVCPVVLILDDSSDYVAHTLSEKTALSSTNASIKANAHTEQIKLTVSAQTCAACSNLPSNIIPIIPR